MADEKKKAPDAALLDRIAELELELESRGPSKAELNELVAKAVAEALKAQAVPKAAVRFELAPEHRGTHTYVVGPSRHWRNNRVYEKGELVTVTDERPAKDWVLASKSQQQEAPDEDAPRFTTSGPSLVGKRASDADVG